MDMRDSHFAQVTSDIYEDLNELSRRYDAKTLAIAMLTRSAYLLRVLQCLGVMEADDINNTIVEAIKDVHSPVATNELPPTKNIGAPRKLS